MRRILAPLLLLLLLTISVTLIILSKRTSDVMPGSEESTPLRTTAHALLDNKNKSTEDTLKAAELLDKASQIDARHAEILKQSGPAWKSVVNDLSPVITVLVLAGTFIFNVIQARITENQKRADDKRRREDKLQDIARQDDADEKKRKTDELKRYTDAAQLIGKEEGISPAATLIRTFTTEPHRSEARQLGRQILLTTKSYDRFQDLFNTVIEPVTLENLTQVIDLLRSVHADAGPLITKTWFNNTNDLTRLTPTEVDAYNLIINERTFLSVRVAAALQLPRDPAMPLDLSRLGFDNCSLAGVDLRNATISPGAWNLVNLDGADLRGITNFENCWFYNTAWWHASRIDTPLLQYFIKQAPFYEGQYVNSLQPISRKDYDENIARLQSLTG